MLEPYYIIVSEEVFNNYEIINFEGFKLVAKPDKFLKYNNCGFIFSDEMIYIKTILLN